MRFVVTGASGMLGRDIVACLSGRDVLALGHTDLDITDEPAVASLVRPGDVIFNCAAYNAVDLAETQADEARAVNTMGVAVLARVAATAGAKLVHFSTDYVFDGRGTSPYHEDQPRGPLSVYGRSKADGEFAAREAHPNGSYIVRTAWLYGEHGRNFARTMLTMAQSTEEWPVVDDQRGQPTWTRDLAEQVIALVDFGAPAGVYHGTNAGEASWFDFAQAILAEAGLDPNRIRRASSDDVRRPAPRPGYSVLGHDHWAEVGLTPMRPWRDALHDAFRSGVFDRERAQLSEQTTQSRGPA